MHTDSSLAVFREVTTVLGDSLRFFANETCRHFTTVETDREYQARQRTQARKYAKSGKKGPPTAPGGRRTKEFNLETSKAHALPDYPRHIELYGTTDSYTTQTVSR
jgi:hypothetical protein